jgi:hypothetical protein
MSTNDDLDHRKMMDWVRPDIPAHGNVIGMLATTFELDRRSIRIICQPSWAWGMGDTSWANRVAMQRALAQTEATVVMMDARRFLAVRAPRT